MSAFVCSAKLIGIVAQRVIEKYQCAGTPVSVPDFAEKMARLNVESVDYRYNETTDAVELDAFVAECRKVSDSQVTWDEKISDTRLLGAVGCFLYQSCESDACVDSETYQLVKRFESFLEGKGIKSEGWSIA
jgi:hypothetical protein